MKNKGMIIALIVLLAICAVALLVFLVLLLTGNTKFRYFGFSHSVSEELVFEEVYENEFDEVNITASAADISIKTSSDEKVHVRIYGDKERTSVDVRSGKLKMEIKSKKCFGFCFNQKIAKIEIEIPSDFDKKIEIKNDYGNIEIDEFLNADIEIEENCGDVFVQGGREVDVKNDYGDIQIEKAVNIKVKESAGDVTIGQVEVIDVKNNFGDIKIREVNGYMNVEQDCGDVEVDYAILTKNSKIENNLGDIKIGSTNEIYIDAKTSLGNVKINKNESKSDVTLKLENSCGDIKVNN